MIACSESPRMLRKNAPKIPSTPSATSVSPSSPSDGSGTESKFAIQHDHESEQRHGRRDRESVLEPEPAPDPLQQRLVLAEVERRVRAREEPELDDLAADDGDERGDDRDRDGPRGIAQPAEECKRQQRAQSRDDAPRRPERRTATSPMCTSMKRTCRQASRTLFSFDSPRAGDSRSGSRRPRRPRFAAP